MLWWLKEKEIEWFQSDYENQYMSSISQVKPEKKLVPAITHVDGSARLQTVDESLNPKLTSLIKSFYNITKSAHPT